MKAKDLDRHCDGLIADTATSGDSDSSTMRLLHSNHWKPLQEDNSEEWLSSRRCDDDDDELFTKTSLTDALLTQEDRQELPSGGRLLRRNARVRPSPFPMICTHINDTKPCGHAAVKKSKHYPSQDERNKLTTTSKTKTVHFAQDFAGQMVEHVFVYEPQSSLVAKEELWYSPQELQRMQQQIQLQVQCSMGWVQPVMTRIWDLAHHYPVPTTTEHSSQRLPKRLACANNSSNNRRDVIHSKMMQLLYDSPGVMAMRGLERYFVPHESVVHEVLHTQQVLQGSPCQDHMKWRVLAQTAHEASRPSVAVAQLLSYYDARSVDMLVD